MKGYKTSKDYKRLKELLDEGHKIIVLYPSDFSQRFPLATVAFKCKDGSYCVAGNSPSFEDVVHHCESNNIEFIEPTED